MLIPAADKNNEFVGTTVDCQLPAHVRLELTTTIDRSTTVTLAPEVEIPATAATTREEDALPTVAMAVDLSCDMFTLEHINREVTCIAIPPPDAAD